jgi:uncharacterized membrane protein
LGFGGLGFGTKETTKMRKSTLAALAALAAGLASVASSAPAAARDYPWCVQGRMYGIPGDCSYPTYEACMARASGTDAYCGENPRFAFGRARRGVAPYPDRYR